MLADTTHPRWPVGGPLRSRSLAGHRLVRSPCVFPLVPGYLSFVTGASAVDGGWRATPTNLGRADADRLFIGGFTLVFALLGAFASDFVRLFKGSTGPDRSRASSSSPSGLLMIGYAFGRGSIALYAERRPFLHKVRPGVAGAFPWAWRSRRDGRPASGRCSSGIFFIAST